MINTRSVTVNTKHFEMNCHVLGYHYGNKCGGIKFLAKIFKLGYASSWAILNWGGECGGGYDFLPSNERSL